MIEKKKRKGTRAKGRAFEKRCADILEEYGYFTYTAPPKLGWYKDQRTGELQTRAVSQDIFDCIDILAKKKTGSLLWIQCGDRANLSKKKHDVESFGGWTSSDEVALFIKNTDRTIAVFYLMRIGQPIQVFAEIGRFNTRREWEPRPAYIGYSFGTRTPKTRKVENG